MQKTYTVGEVARLGLLKNHQGKPYKHKETVLRIVKSLPHERTMTPWGIGYAISAATIKEFNERNS